MVAEGLAWAHSHVWLIAALVAAGLVAGFLAGLLGIGGGGVIVPVLYETFRVLDVAPDHLMHLTLGTTLAVLAPTTLRSFYGHYAKGSVDMTLWRRFAPWVLLGVVAGVITAHSASGTSLKWVWIVISALVALKLALGREDWRLGDRVPVKPWFETAFFGFGWLSTLMSIGGGTFVVPYLTLYGRSILSAVASAASFGPLIAVPGLFGYMWAGWGADTALPLTLGYVSVLTALCVAPLSVVAAPVGVRLAHGVKRRTLELSFAAFLACVCARFLSTL